MSELPESMPAAVLQRPGVVVVEERPVPRPAPSEVLVEVSKDDESRRQRWSR